MLRLRLNTLFRPSTPSRLKPYSTPSAPKIPSRLTSYITTLRQRYPNADPASLIASFLILHELTAVVPLVLGFFGLRSLGVGESTVAWLLTDTPGRAEGDESWVQKSGRRWIAQGEEMAEKVGRRYGVLGYARESRKERAQRKQKPSSADADIRKEPYLVGGDVANLAVAYVGVKLLIPFRLAFSARYAPVMANAVISRFKGLRNVGARYLRKSS